SLEYPFECGDVVFERCQGNRCTRYLKVLVSQRQNDILPAGTVRPRAVDQYDCGVRGKRGHCAAPARNRLIAAAISTACVSRAKWRVSRNSIRAFGISFRNASAPAGIKNGSFLPQIASNGGFAFRKYS